MQLQNYGTDLIIILESYQGPKCKVIGAKK
jgi:hypothetical protein